MPESERLARETFYQNLVWIIDGNAFRNQFDFYHRLPAPDGEVAKDLVWFKARRGLNGANNGLFWRRSENPEVRPGSGEMVRVRSIRDVQSLIDQTFIGHQQYDWVRPRTVWLDAKCPVYIDFGFDWLFRLDRYGESGMPCLFRISKNRFVFDSMNQPDATAIGRL